MELPQASLVFKVRRRAPEIVSPAKPTPRELKILSCIDDQDGIRLYNHFIFFYRHNPSVTTDPVGVIRKAVAETLVHFYPFAGRLHEGPNKRLIVDCNGEGVVFVEADADVALDEFGDVLHPPFPCLEELLPDVDISSGVLNSPLLLFQVTRLKCGGFILTFNFCHSMCDGVGLGVFLKAVGELARGANAPSVPHAWDRHLLNPRVPPRITCVHRAYGGDDDDTTSHDRTVQRSFFFGPREISSIRRLLPPHLRDRSTSFELLTSLLWRCRTIALGPAPNTQQRLCFNVHARSLLRSPPLPQGFYGNAVVHPAAIATAKELLEQPLEFALKLVREAKSSGATEEFLRSTVDFLATGRRNTVLGWSTFVVSDVRRLGFEDVDFGWGTPLYGAPAKAGILGFDGLTIYARPKKEKDESGILAPIILPEPAMERFAEELSRVLNDQVPCGASNNPEPLSSSL